MVRAPDPPALLITHMSNPYLGPAGAFLPHMFLSGAWRGAGFPVRGWLQQDLQQVHLHGGDHSVLFTEPKTMLMHRLEGWGQSQYQSYQERYNSQFYAQVGHHQTIKHPSNKVKAMCA